MLWLWGAKSMRGSGFNSGRDVGCATSADRVTTRRRILLALGATALATALPAPAQQPPRLRRIGMITSTNVASYATNIAALRAGMAELRWVEGRDYAIEVRYANGDDKALDGAATELAAWQPEVVVMASESSIPATVREMPSVPIVFAFGADPVGLRYAASLARPGGNVTGISSLGDELAAKRLELLKEAFPRIAQVGVLHDARRAPAKNLPDAAARLKLRLTPIPLRLPTDIEAGIKRAAALGVSAYLVHDGPFPVANIRAIVEGIARARAPAIYYQSRFAEAGGLMSYATSPTDNFRRTAGYVEKILKGARPGDLPIEQPTKFELVINLKSAKAMGLAIPQSVLLRADRLIE
jgi:putative ABC transport system substrate-binding protein